ncbi:porin [Xylophilus sp. GW821-FHT01B05]
MKRVIFLAGMATAIALPAAAQSSVSLFGVVDATAQRASQGGASVNRLLGTGGNQISRLGFRGTEDLGGGWSAGFVLDMGLNVDTGTGGAISANNQTVAATGGALVFNRRSTVSLAHTSLGELRLGRDFTPTYWNLTFFDPFGTAGAGSAANIIQGNLSQVSTVQTALRASNSIGYVLPRLGGFYGQAMVAMGENGSAAANGTKRDGNYAGFRAGYAAGALDVALSHGKTSLFSGDVSTTNAAASYNLGFIKPMAQIFQDRKDKIAAPNRSSGFLLGATVPLGAGYIPLAYSRIHNNAATERQATQLAVGYVYNLSKRTAVYSTLSHIRNRNGAAVSGGGVAGVANAGWSGLDLGIRHSF